MVGDLDFWMVTLGNIDLYVVLGDCSYDHRDRAYDRVLAAREIEAMRCTILNDL